MPTHMVIFQSLQLFVCFSFFCRMNSCRGFHGTYASRLVLTSLTLLMYVNLFTFSMWPLTVQLLVHPTTVRKGKKKKSRNQHLPRIQTIGSFDECHEWAVHIEQRTPFSTPLSEDTEQYSVTRVFLVELKKKCERQCEPETTHLFFCSPAYIFWRHLWNSSTMKDCSLKEGYLERWCDFLPRAFAPH